jgi:hypothetical protein
MQNGKCKFQNEKLNAAAPVFTAGSGSARDFYHTGVFCIPFCILHLIF